MGRTRLAPLVTALVLGLTASGEARAVDLYRFIKCPLCATDKTDKETTDQGSGTYYYYQTNMFPSASATLVSLGKDPGRAVQVNGFFTESAGSDPTLQSFCDSMSFFSGSGSSLSCSLSESTESPGPGKPFTTGVRLTISSDKPITFGESIYFDPVSHPAGWTPPWLPGNAGSAQRPGTGGISGSRG